MPATEVDPSALTPHELSKMNKKDVVKYLGVLQEMFAERGKKYGMSRNDPFNRFISTHPPTQKRPSLSFAKIKQWHRLEPKAPVTS